MLTAYGYSCKPGDKEITCENYYDSSMLTIPLDPEQSAMENAKRYFNKYNKLKRTYEALMELTVESKEELDYLLSVQNSLEIAKTENDLQEIKQELVESGYVRGRFDRNKQKKQVKAKPLHYISSDGYHMYVGKNNFQNEELTFKFAEGNDLWFHAKQMPGSHVIARESASLLAEKVNCESVNEMSKVVCDADLYIVSVKDDALEMLIPELCKGREDKMFVHTAGSMPMDVFKDYARHYGVFYPMQTFTKDKKVAFENIPIFIEGCGAFETSFLKRLAEQISRSVYELDSDNRKYLHLSAVFACNFANHCVAIGQQILENHHIPGSVLRPLVMETMDKASSHSAAEVQTGPAIRDDRNVMEKQMQLLEKQPELQQIYEMMSKSIFKFKR